MTAGVGGRFFNALAVLCGRDSEGGFETAVEGPQAVKPGIHANFDKRQVGFAQKVGGMPGTESAHILC